MTPKPVLLIMAAGLGSRYGGLKQIDPVDNAGQLLIDYSIYDAKQAGFETVIFVVAPGRESDFHERIGVRVARHMDVRYAAQRPDTLPAGFAVPPERKKPWGTAHAVLSAKQEVAGRPFLVINADDFYGRSSYQKLYEFLMHEALGGRHAMMGYRLENTLTENGHVARGVCRTDPEGYLVEVVERTQIEQKAGGPAYTEDGENWTSLPPGTTVSMNMWGFAPSMMEEIESHFSSFLKENLAKNPLKCEYYLPLVVNELLREHKASFQVLPTAEKWYGVTYAADMPIVRAALAALRKEGLYPEQLW